MTKQNTEDIFYGKEPNWKFWNKEDFADIEKVAWSLALAANWYNVRYSERDYRSAVLDYADRLKITDREFLRKLGTEAFEFRAIGGKCQASNKGCILPPMFQQRVDETIASLIQKGKLISTDESPVETISVRDRVRAQSCELASELEEQVDEYMEYLRGNRPHYKQFDIEAWLTSAEPSGMHCEFMLQTFDPRSEELKMALLGENKELLEGYSFFSKPKLRKFYDFHKMLCDHLKLRMSIVKSNRKPRKKKKRKPEQLVKKLKYLAKDTNTGAESIMPEDIIGASTVITYNTKTRKATLFVGDPSQGGLVVKGSSIIGFDLNESKEKTIKKPTDFIKVAKKDGIRAINNAWKAINTKESLPKGRINGHTLILRAIK
jgi:hypothetical protein